MMVLAVLAALMTVIAVAFASRPAAIAVAVAGGVALLVFLIIDLPAVNSVGNLNSACGAGNQFFNAKAVPQGGFWLELIGAARAGGRRNRAGDAERGPAASARGRRAPSASRSPAPVEGESGSSKARPATADAAHAAAEAEPAKFRLPRRPRARQRG